MGAILNIKYLAFLPENAQFQKLNYQLMGLVAQDSIILNARWHVPCFYKDYLFLFIRLRAKKGPAPPP